MSTIAARPLAWIRDACRSFSEAAGWNLQFVPVESAASDDPGSRLRNDPETCWSQEITDGTSRVGFLQLCLPAAERDDHSFAAVGRLAETFAGVISRALAAGRMAEARSDELTTFVNIGRALPMEQNLVDALDRLLRGVIQLTPFRSTAFFLLDPSTERLKLRAAVHREAQAIPLPARRLSENPPDLEALARGRLIIHDDRIAQVAAWLPTATATAACLAVGSDAGPIGTLWVYDRRSREPTDREIHVLESIGVQIASLLERVVLLRESAAQHRLQRDLQLASQSQSFDIVTPLPEESGIEAAVRSTSRFEIGGDLCELISLEGGRTAISIGDASGHGISAAIIMSAVRGAVRAVSLNARDPNATGEVLEQVNRALHSITPSHQFMSLFYGVIDPKRRTLTYSNAGHPSPVFMTPGGPTSLDSHGMLLGVLSEAGYGESTLPLLAGDTLVAFTDGVSEAMNSKRKMFRSDGIVDALRERRAESPHQILEAIWSQLENHMGGDSGHDDRSLMVIRVR